LDKDTIPSLMIMHKMVFNIWPRQIFLWCGTKCEK